jgi:Lrp/AsnC family leucine-responsive transcriptional regulator
MESNITKTNYVIKLSMKDRRIIRELNRNSRQSFSEIGKKVGLPKNVVNYRIKKMIDNGLITLFTTVVNRSKLGYMYCRLFLKFRHFTEKIEDELISYISKLKNVHWVASLEGNFDFCIIFLAKTLKQLDDVYNSIIYRFDKYIIDKELSIANRFFFLPYNYLYDKPECKINEIKVEDVLVKLDKKDYELINLMKENSRIPMLELMKKMNATPQTIRSRIKKLMKNKIITGFNIRIDHTKFKLHHFHTFLNLAKMNQLIENKLIHFLCSKKSTTHIIKGFGRWDFEFESVLPSHFELHELLKELKNNFPENVLKYDSVLIYKIYPINTVKYE